MVKKILFLILLVCLISGSVVSGAAPAYKIGLVSPFTGLGSILGEYCKGGLVLAIDEINSAGGVRGRKIEYIVYDDAASPATSINVVTKAILNDRVDAVFGPNMSSCVLAVHQVASENRVPMLVGATSPSLGYDQLKNAWLFRLRADDAVKVINLTKYAVETEKCKKPAIITGSTDYCVAARDVAIREFKKYGLEVAVSEQIKEGDKDATGQLLKIQRSGADLLIGLTHEPEAAVVVRQVRQLNMNLKILGFSAWGVPAFTDLAGDAAIGVIAVQGFTPEFKDKQVQNFVKKYNAKWGKLPSDPAQAYYDGVYALADVIKKVGFDKVAIRKGLENLQGVRGVQGKLVCDKKHNFSNFSIISRFKGDQWEIIQAIY
jgi:branched-chain amino acid transport system substrate-binding protein